MAATWARYRVSSLAVLGAETWTRISSMYLFVVFDLDGVVSCESCVFLDSLEEEERLGPIGVFVSLQCDGGWMQQLLNCDLAGRSLDIEIDILLMLKRMSLVLDNSLLCASRILYFVDEVVLAILVRA